MSKAKHQVLCATCSGPAMAARFYRSLHSHVVWAVPGAGRSSSLFAPRASQALVRANCTRARSPGRVLTSRTTVRARRKLPAIWEEGFDDQDKAAGAAARTIGFADAICPSYLGSDENSVIRTQPN